MSALDEAERWALAQVERFNLGETDALRLQKILVEAWRKGFHKGVKSATWAMRDHVLKMTKPMLRHLANAEAGHRTPDEEL